MADPLTFVIEETIGPDPIRVELRDHDLPFGRPRKGGAFDLGGPANFQEVMLDGRNTPILHSKQIDFHPTVVKGHLRDHFTGQEGRSFGIVQQLERIRSRMRPCRLSIWRLEWTAVLKDTKFPFEGRHDFPYELTFRVLKGPGLGAPKQGAGSLLPMAPVDLMARARVLLAERMATTLAISLSRVAVSQINSAASNLERTLEAAEQAARDFENAPQRASAQAKALIARCQDAKDRADALTAAFHSHDASQALSRVTAGSAAAYRAQQAGAAADVVNLKSELHTLQLHARQRIRKTTRIYQVGEEDSLESIAAAELGSAARAPELGIRPQDLVVGRYIRIPVVK